jgi:predicted metal-dependent phosphoesterase TrpH
MRFKRYDEMKLDLHVHTCYSADGRVKPEEYLKMACKIHLDGFAVTDHNEIIGAKKTFELAKRYKDLTIIRGIEVSSSDGHILGYGVREKIPRGLTPEETVEQIMNAGGVAIAAHPYRRASGLGETVVKRVKFDNVEVLNHRSPRHENDRAKELADELKAGTVGGSDGHEVKELGLAGTEFSINGKSEDDIIAELSKHRTKPVGESSTAIEGLKMYSKLVIFWIKRGFRRI